jgi:hypothetical protein
VSRLWRDEVAIYLAPRKLVLVRRARGPGRRVAAAAEVAIPDGTGGDVAPVLARLADVLREPAWRGAAARALVADPWARYAILPWPSTRLDAAERLAHARCVLVDAYGEAVADWTVTVADIPPGRPSIACAMPATLRGALEDTLAQARVKLVSLRPQLIAAFNAWRRHLPAGDAWFISVDDGSLAAVHLHDGAWDRVHTARLSSDWRVELERLHAFSRLTRAAGALDPMFVDAPRWMRTGAVGGPGIEWLDDRANDAAQAYELALLQKVHA